MKKICLADISKRGLKNYFLTYEPTIDTDHIVIIFEMSGMYYQANEENSKIICFPINPLEEGGERFPDAISTNNEPVSIYDLVYEWYDMDYDIEDMFIYV